MTKFNLKASVFALMLFLSHSVLASETVEIESAMIVSEGEVRVVLTQNLDPENITVFSSGTQISGTSIQEGEKSYLFFTDNELDFTKRYHVRVGDKTKDAQVHWKAIDDQFTYDGKLGISYSESATIFRLWAPLATEVTLNLFEDGSEGEAYKSIRLQRKAKGVWEVNVLEDLFGKFYTYSVTNYGETKEVLDPYAYSQGITKTNDITVGRGAILDPSKLGPELDFANIPGFEKREDAIIWEIHVRDFTVDKDLKTKAQFGTYRAFTEKVDYIAQLGVTHVQLLPVLSYARGDESINGTREWDYKIGANYNWGYDPHNYFAVEGMYSEIPTDPALRIVELKDLVRSVHEQGMGVTLDVVYNHTAALSILEDIVPGYYHFMDEFGNAKQSYGGGRPGTTHAMTRKLVIDSMIYWLSTFKVDGFRFDLMGDLDGETIELAFQQLKKINPNVIMVGEGWRTFAGDDGEKVVPADQDWMGMTESASSFSDEMRNEIKSGFGSEGQPRFITGGARDIKLIFNNVIAKPGNMTEDDPGDVLQYLAAHDNLTLHDVIAHSAHLDPEHDSEELHKRIRLGNAIVLTSQGTAFLHGGQEYGRTKVWKGEEAPENDFTYVEGFEHPYFIHNSYDASDIVNYFDWDKVTEQGIHKETMEFTRGLIELRKSTDAFHLATEKEIAEKVRLLDCPEIKETDLIIAFSASSTNGEEFVVFINADNQSRTLTLKKDLSQAKVLVDDDEATATGVSQINGVSVSSNSITIDPLTVVVLKK